MNDDEGESDDNRDYRAFYDNKYMRAWDLPPDRNVTLTVHHTERHVIKAPGKAEDPRPVIFFLGRNGKPLKKGLVLNRGMGKIVKALYGKNMREWRGNELTVYATTCFAFDETHDVIRIRPSVMKGKPGKSPATPPPALPPGREDIADADFEITYQPQQGASR